tara:strand:- start:6840 stop:7799 length:960 start_codon:yes stop_codon:yes gene_type:complete
MSLTLSHPDTDLCESDIMARPYDLPSMTSLLCFEAAARHLSFKAAASELNVTPAAVSHQIKALESELGRQLFTRHHRGVEFTEVGAFLFVALQKGFESISETVQSIRERSDRPAVVVRSTSAMSAFWLTPQISAFWKRHPEISVSQIVSDIENSAQRCDLSIHYGTIPEDGGEYRLLFRDRILALGSPAYASLHGIREARDLLQAPLIHITGEGARWTGWPDWLRTVGLGAPVGKSLSVNNYMIALQMAQDDDGAVLGWDGLVGPLMTSGRLVNLVADSIPSPECFYLKVHSRVSANALLFRDWLVDAGDRNFGTATDP